MLVAQRCPTLCDPLYCSPSGSSVHGIFPARILEWVSMTFSRTRDFAGNSDAHMGVLPFSGAASPPLSCSLTPGPNDLIFYVISSLAPEVGSWGWHMIQVETSQLFLRIFQSEAAAIHTLPRFCLLPSETLSLQPSVPPLKKQKQDFDGEETGRQLWWCWSLWIQSFLRPALSCPCAAYDLAMWVNRLSVFKNRDFCLMPPKPSD